MLRDKNGLTEEEYIAAYRKKNYEHPYLTADIVIIDPIRMSVMLVKRGGHPYLGKYAFPGGFANPDESIEQTAERELMEETSVTGLSMQSVGLYSQPGRDPRGWVVSQVFAAYVNSADCHPKAGDDAAAAKWFIMNIKDNDIELTCGDEKIHASDLAFDHAVILKDVLEL